MKKLTFLQAFIVVFSRYVPMFAGIGAGIAIQDHMSGVIWSGFLFVGSYFITVDMPNRLKKEFENQ